MDELKDIEERLKQLEMKKERLERRTGKEQKQLERKIETRKKIIIGSIFAKYFGIDLNQSEEQISELTAIIASVFEPRVKKFKDTIEGVNDHDKG